MDTTFLITTQPLMISKAPTRLSLLRTLKDEFLVIVRVTGQVQTPFSESLMTLKSLMIDLVWAPHLVLETDLVSLMV